jgi:hypothetical protein
MLTVSLRRRTTCMLSVDYGQVVLVIYIYTLIVCFSYAHVSAVVTFKGPAARNLEVSFFLLPIQVIYSWLFTCYSSQYIDRSIDTHSHIFCRSAFGPHHHTSSASVTIGTRPTSHSRVSGATAPPLRHSPVLLRHRA